MAAVQGTQKASDRNKEGAKKKKPRNQVFIDMTPMVDIAFLLLIFFMVTTVFRAPQTMELNIPPDKDDKVEIAESNVLLIYMLDDDRMFWQIGRDMTPEELTLDDVQEFIKEKEVENADLHDGESKLVTLVMIQRTSPYEQMVNVMDELQLGAIDRFSITVLEQDKFEEVFGS
ncbi:MAG: biopolymer transporter ExbD [Gemmatimonadetes bacterium]|nr:biopolymer transporter ExbD [Gemmatimonadota bacterium]MXZ75617.1 biopolymer transporter ExbD [Gemmatimonadota bacterium]MYA77435.1 biopolymer transporter ExbD [Gemmatimonadota bacterium]MYG16837.1 biopolymer transporter ExbD [Gemmatimonadota bacterium]MYH18034.1 biopolymer transporter ExbD [Gemmatimonadota bacterium]